MNAIQTIAYMDQTAANRTGDDIAWLAECAFRSFYRKGSLQDWTANGTTAMDAVCKRTGITREVLNKLVVETHNIVNGRENGRKWLVEMYRALRLAK